MSGYTEPSRILANELRVGQHALSNQELRRVYGVSRVTAKARAEIAHELQRAGLQVLSDPRSEPLVVRKLAPARAPKAPRASRSGRPWWRRPWVIAAGAFLLLCIVVAGLDTEHPGSSTEQAALGDPVAESTATPTATPTPTVETIAQARAAVADDDYAQALAIAAVLGEDDDRSIQRRIARRLAFRATKALRAGHRTSASRLLREARDYPRTSEVKRAGAALVDAQERARERAAAKRRAAALARADRRARAEARAEARRRAAVESVPPATSAPEPSMSGPSSVNWCGKRDGDGDGIYCEGL